MHQPIPIKEAKSKASEIFHRTVELIYEKHLLEGEIVLFVGECTYHKKESEERVTLSGISKYVDVIYNTASLLILTNKRWFRMPTDYYTKTGPRILQDKNTVDRFFETVENKLKYRWIYPSPSLPDKKYWKRTKETLDEFSEKGLRIVPLSNITVYDRGKFFIKEDKIIKDIFRIKLNSDWWVSFPLKEGESVHQLLQMAATNKGIITTEPPTSKPAADTNLVERLAALKEMLDRDLITEQEYQTKKEEILKEL